MAYVFISYSHKDKGYAHRLEKVLKQRDFEVWLDDRIDYGAKWPKTIQQKLDGCTALVLIMTARSEESDWVQKELTRAGRKRKSIFPLLLEGDEPWLSVETMRYVDVRGGKLPPEDFYDTLAKVVLRKKEKKATSARTQANFSILRSLGEKQRKVNEIVSGLGRCRYGMTLGGSYMRVGICNVERNGHMDWVRAELPLMGKSAPIPELIKLGWSVDSDQPNVMPSSKTKMLKKMWIECKKHHKFHNVANFLIDTMALFSTKPSDINVQVIHHALRPYS